MALTLLAAWLGCGARRRAHRAHRRPPAASRSRRRGGAGRRRGSSVAASPIASCVREGALPQQACRRRRARRAIACLKVGARREGVLASADRASPRGPSRDIAAADGAREWPRWPRGHGRRSPSTPHCRRLRPLLDIGRARDSRRPSMRAGPGLDRRSEQPGYRLCPRANEKRGRALGRARARCRSGWPARPGDSAGARAALEGAVAALLARAATDPSGRLRASRPRRGCEGRRRRSRCGRSLDC